MDDLIKLLQSTFGYLQELQKVIEDFRQEMLKEEREQKKVSPRLVIERTERFLTQLNEGFKNLKVAMELADRLGKTELRPIKPDALAERFRTMIESIQRDARKPRMDEVGATLKSLDVEVKGLIVVEDDEARIITPTPGRVLDPGLLSTIRMSFGTIPVPRQTEEE